MMRPKGNTLPYASATTAIACNCTTHLTSCFLADKPIMDQPQTTQGGQLPILKIPLVFYGLPSDPSVPRRSGDITRLDEYVVRLTEELKVQITKAKASNATSIPDDLYRAVK